MIEIDESKYSGISEHVEEALKHMGKVMQCISDMRDESSEYEPISRSHRRKSYQDYDDDEREYRSSGRYSRY